MQATTKVVFRKDMSRWRLPKSSKCFCKVLEQNLSSPYTTEEVIEGGVIISKKPLLLIILRPNGQSSHWKFAHNCQRINFSLLLTRYMSSLHICISADPSPPSSRGRRLGRTKQMALALTFCLVARNSHVSAATIRHRAFSGVEGLSTPGALLFRMGCPAPRPLHSPCF